MSEWPTQEKPAKEHILANYDAGAKELKNVIKNAFDHIYYSSSIKSSLDVKVLTIENQVMAIYNSDEDETIKYFSDAEKNEVLNKIEVLRSSLNAWEESKGKLEHKNNVRDNFKSLAETLSAFGTSEGALNRYDVTSAHAIIIYTIKSLEDL